MKKQLHILEGIMILLIVFIAFLCASKFIHYIKGEYLDTSYMWDISFTNLNIAENSKGDINYTDDSLTLSVILKEPNEFSSFTIDIENKGTIDAVLSEYLLNVENATNILTYEVKYLDGREIKEGDLLKSHSKETIEVKILYPKTEQKIYKALELKLSLNMRYISAN